MRTGKSPAPALSFERLLEIAQNVPEAQVHTWKDIAQLDVRPGGGVIRIRSKNRYEVQVDSGTGEILEQGNRITGLLIALHEGSWFGSSIKYLVFLPATLLLFMLWITGMVLWLQPYFRKTRTPAPVLKESSL